MPTSREPEPTQRAFANVRIAQRSSPRRVLLAAATTAGAIGLSLLAFRPPDLSTEALVLVLGVAATARWCGRWPSLLAALVCALAFNFLMIEPRFTFHIAEPAYLLAFAAMAVVGIGVASLVARADERATEAEAERLRSTLLASVSHDLRTPLTTITAAASRLQHEDAQLSPAARAELAASIATEASRMNDLVSNLLFATRLEASAVTPRTQWTSVAEVIGSALQRPSFAHRAVTLRVDPDLPLLEADPILLEQALHNLLDNAFRHTTASPRVTVRAGVDGASARLEVEDDGPGLDASLVARVGQRFARGDGSRGLGLGLAIVAGIARAHGGTLEHHAVAPHGTRFCLRLPLPRSQPRLPAQELAS